MFPWDPGAIPTILLSSLGDPGLLGANGTAGCPPTETKLRSSEYLNNLIEQDHRSVKQRVAVMLAFKQFRNAAITIADIELMHRVRKGQFGLRRLSVQGGAAPGVWNATLGV